MLNCPKLQFLYTNIGRGHPFYLDGIVESLIRAGETGLIRGSTDVFAQSRFLSRQIWKLARLFYRQGSSAGFIGKTYNRFRESNDYNQPSYLIRLAGRDLVRAFSEASDNSLLVAHPILVGILSGRPGLIYQHGELVAPDESLVKGANYVLVPTESVAAKFHSIGYVPDQVIVTGLCLEPALVRQAADAFELRNRRLSEPTPLTGALFSSGAEPREHVKLLVSVARSLLQAGQKVIISVTNGGPFEREVGSLVGSTEGDSVWISTRTDIPRELPGLAVISSSSRREENSLVAQLFPQFDFLVAPPHERVNWAVGLGLPMFAVTPCYGSYASLNLELLLARKVALPIENEVEAQTFGECVIQMRQSRALADMAQAGWGRETIDGFGAIASWLRATMSR